MVWMNLDSSVIAAAGLIRTTHQMTVGNLVSPTQTNGGFQNINWTGGAQGGFVVGNFGSKGYRIGRYGCSLGTLTVYVTGANVPRDTIQRLTWNNPVNADYDLNRECDSYNASVTNNGIAYTQFVWSGSNVQHGFTGDVGTVTIYAK
jgi:hypothetical protein